MATENEDLGARGYSAFVSHASADADYAEQLAAALEAKCLTCWIAPRDVRVGAEYGEEILRGILDSKVFILILSAASNLSLHVRREVERAASNGKPIYPVRIEEVLPSPKLEYFVSMHHWLDAWDGLTEAHTERLASAISSKEEWIANRVEKRRRIIRSGGLVTLASAVLLSAAVVFQDDIRSIAKSPDQQALEGLKESGITFDVVGLSRTMAVSDSDNLRKFAEAGVPVSSVQTAFSDGDVALGFFKNSKGNDEALDWLTGTLNSGLDPNGLIQLSDGSRVGLLHAAVKAENVDALTALIEAGASPHIYQEIFLTTDPEPFFVYPYAEIGSIAGLSIEEKGRIAAAFVSSGIGVPLPTDLYEYERSTDFRVPRERLERISEEARLSYNVEIPVASSICDAEPTTVCLAASRRSGFDWCAFAQGLPHELRSETSYYEFDVIELAQLVNIVENKAYFSARLPYGYEPGYGIVEVSRDGMNWTVMKFGPSSVAGMGICAGSSGSGLDWCWRRVEIASTNDPTTMKMFDYYDVKASFCSP